MIEISKETWQKIFKARDIFFKKFIDDVQDDLYPSQKKLSNAIIKSVILQMGKTFASAFTRQFGKTTTVTGTDGFLLLYYFQICRQFKIPCPNSFNIGFFAPNYDQSRTAFDMLRTILKKVKDSNLYDIEFESFNGNTLTIISKDIPNRKVYCFTANPGSNVESKTLHLIHFDESQDLDDKHIKKAILPMGARTNATVTYIGVAGYRECMFRKHLVELEGDNKLILPYNLALKEENLMFQKYKNPIYLKYNKWIKKQLIEIGIDSQEFQTQYEMKWILERGQFITYDNLMNLENDYEVLEQYGKFEKCYAGIDWGKMHDSTILTFVDMEGKIIGWYEWQGDDYSSQIEDIYDIIINKYSGCEVVYCDASGNQDMGVDHLARKFMGNKLIKTSVVGIKFTPQSKDNMFKNLSKLMHPIFSTQQGEKLIIQDAFLKFSSDKKFVREREKFIRQFLDLQKDERNNLWSVSHPKGPNYHDDYNDSLALACLGFQNDYNNQKHEFTLA